MGFAMKLSVVIPVYNEEKAIEANFSAIYDTLKGVADELQFVLVDDGSKDGTWLALEKLSGEYGEIIAVRFARNFGKEMAISAGIDYTDGDRTIVMDSDLQHPPKHIASMMKTMDETDCDIVEGIKSDRGKESLKYKLCAKTFYKLLHLVSGMKMENSTDFKLMNRKVVDAIKRFKESNLFFRGVVDWCGFDRVEHPFEVEERTAGKTSFSVFKLMKLSMDAVVSHTSRPLYLTVFIGAVFLIFAIVLGIQSLYNYFAGIAQNGFSTVILIVLIASSLIMISMGIVGVYISRIYDEVKGRPRYLVSAELGKSKDI